METDQERLLRYLKRKSADEVILEIYSLLRAGLTPVQHIINDDTDKPKFEDEDEVELSSKIDEIRSIPNLSKDKSNELKKLKKELGRLHEARRVVMQQYRANKEKMVQKTVDELYKEFGWTKQEIRESGALERFAKNGFK